MNVSINIVKICSFDKIISMIPNLYLYTNYSSLPRVSKLAWRGRNW
ncbi:MAG: hypothetical protein AB8V03_06860 [Francisella endosymbiont of Hyalomma asiaticum]